MASLRRDLRVPKHILTSGSLWQVPNFPGREGLFSSQISPLPEIIPLNTHLDAEFLAHLSSPTCNSTSSFFLANLLSSLSNIPSPASPIFASLGLQ